MIIIGAGMSGMIAAHILRRFNPIILEAAPTLPNNHAALLRFRSDAVSRATHIPFKKVFVQKAILKDASTGELTTSPSIDLQNLYSYKVSGEVRSRSILNLEAGERYIAPENFITQLSHGLNIKYNSPINQFNKEDENPETTISTIPMTELMKIVDWKDKPEFKFKSILTINADIIMPDIEVYQTIYVPFISMNMYRISITGKKLIIEIMNEDKDLGDKIDASSYCEEAMKLFFGKKAHPTLGLTNIKTKWQKYGKLVPTNSKLRKEFILAMTDLYDVYSLGRFATWRQLLLDDVVSDIKIIESMIEDRDAYSRRMKIV